MAAAAAPVAPNGSASHEVDAETPEAMLLRLHPNHTPLGEVGPGQDGLSEPKANFEGAKVAMKKRI